MAAFTSTLTDEGIRDIYRLLEQGKTADQIQKHLLDVYQHKMGKRNIYYYKKKAAKTATLREKLGPVDWDDVDKLIAAKIRFEHLPMLRRVDAWVSSTFKGKVSGHNTISSLRWQSHVLTYADSIGQALDVWTIGELFAARETFADHKDSPINKDDLEGWLTFAPWENERREGIYLKAIEDGVIPALRPAPGEANELTGENVPRGLLASTLSSLGEKRYMLPSQNIKTYPPTNWSLTEI